MTTRYSMTIEAPSLAELRSRCLVALEGLQGGVSSPDAAQDPDEQAVAAFVADLDAAAGEYTKSLAAYIIGETAAGRVPTSEGFKEEVNRRGPDGRWIGGVTPAVKRLLAKHFGISLSSQYGEGGVVAAWTMRRDLAERLASAL